MKNRMSSILRSKGSHQISMFDYSLITTRKVIDENRKIFGRIDHFKC